MQWKISGNKAICVRERETGQLIMDYKRRQTFMKDSREVESVDLEEKTIWY